VAIGLTMPYPALALLRHRLTPSAYDRAVILAEEFSPESAVANGLVDLVVPAGEVVATAQAIAAMATGLDPAAHAATKLRARAEPLDAIRAGIERERAGVAAPSAQ